MNNPLQGIGSGWRFATACMASVACMLCPSGLYAKVPFAISLRTVSIATCSETSLRVAVFKLPGAAEDDGYLVRYSNSGSEPCVLSGYPVVVGIDPARRDALLARDAKRGMLGGLVEGTTLPRVELSAEGGTGSSVVEATGTATAQSPCGKSGHLPLRLRQLWISVPDSSAAVVRQVSMLVCQGFTANPFVKGTTGENTPSIRHRQVLT